MSNEAEGAQDPVLAWIADPATHPGAPTVKRIDTQGAVVILAGPIAYKIRRAIQLPFLDYSTLARREAASEAEIALNRDAAPDIYLGVTPIRRSGKTFAFDGEGEVVEWATRMRRFDEGATFDRLAERNELTPALIDGLADAVHAAHSRAPVREGGPALASLARYLDQNETAFAERPSLFDADQARALAKASRDELARLKPLLLARAAQGWVRRCHGDLHLRNIVALDGKAVPFDAIEFDEAIATGDVLYDLAFALMDLWERGFPAFANRLLNHYLSHCEAEMFDGLAALPFFLSLRAAIRAKVVAANLEHLGASARDKESAAARRYFDFALRFLEPSPARLVAIGGLSGSGKSTIAGLLAADIGRPPGAIWLRSDVERKHMFGVEETAHLPSSAYRADVSRQTYAAVQRKAEAALRARQSVILDATHSRAAERVAVSEIAERFGVAFAGLWLEAPVDVRASRVDQRRGDASDADAKIAAAQSAEPLREQGWLALDASGDLAATLDRAKRALGLMGA